MKIKNLKLNKCLSTIFIIPTLALVGCGKSDCDMKEYHLHKYEKDGFVRYIDDEHLEKDGYSWTDELIYDNQDNSDFNDFFEDEKLFKIEDNIDALIEADIDMNDFIEYEYFYKVPHHVRTGKITITTFSTSYDWTRDSERGNLTGKARICRYMYTGYKIIKNDNGEYELVKNDSSNNIEDIIKQKDEYPYMNINYYDIEVLKEGDVNEITRDYFNDNNYMRCKK